jgi:hypothetical protein
MPIYFGLPVTKKEAFRLFNINYEKIKYDIEQKHKSSYYSTECYLFDYLVCHFEEIGLQLKIFSTDKGQIIVGYEIREPSDVWNKFINVDQFIIMLSNLKTQFALETKDYEINFREVELERMEGEPEIVRCPIPYIIEYMRN